MRTRATAVVIKGEQILMIHRHNHGEEYWVLPGGGMENGESVEEAAIRELKEETTIDASVKSKLTEFTDTKGDHHVLYLCEYLRGEPKLYEGSVEANKTDEEQLYEPKWMDVQILPSLTIYPNEEKGVLLNYLGI